MAEGHKGQARKVSVSKGADMSKNCAVCGVDFEQGSVRAPRPHARFRCATCKATVCLDCHLFDLKGRRACAHCYRSGRAVTAAFGR